MANTNVLKTKVEQALIQSFVNKYTGVRILELSTREKFYVFQGTEPDLVGVNNENSTLYLGEITTSGYLGQRGKDFHIGAVKKVFESFSKFYLYNLSKDEIISRIAKYYSNLRLENISCHFIVPEGSRFIKALGYRRRLFQTGYMILDELYLPEETKHIMIDVLEKSQKEMKK